MEQDKRVKIDWGVVITYSLTGAIITTIVLLMVFVGKPYFEESQVVGVNSSSMTRIQEAMDRIQSTYVDDVDTEALIQGAISGMAKATEDPYTRYMTEEEYEKMVTAGTEKYGGIGVHITYDDVNSAILVLSVMPNSPALEEGIEAGDLIVKVGDKKVTEDTYNECVDEIKGPEDTKVGLTIKRKEEEFIKEYTRKIISVNNVESKVLEGNIGYIRILSFDNNIAAQFMSEYQKLRSENITGLVIDLRNNPGGLLAETVKIAQNMLPKGEIVKLVYKDKPEKVYTSDGRSEIDIPITVLINGNSASASEILSGAIKDSGKGTLIGTKTFGKGIVQTVERLKEGGALSITTSKYYTSSGVEIHKNGIEPDIEIQLDEEYKNKFYVPLDKDYQLNKAIEVIKQKQ